MKSKDIWLLVLLLFVSAHAAICQDKNYLKLSGRVSAEKASVSDVKIIILDMENQDTIKVIKLLPAKQPTVSSYSAKLYLNKNYKLIFVGDTIFQQTRSINVSTQLLGDSANKNYELANANVSINIGKEVIEEGVVDYNKNAQKFQFSRRMK